VTTQSTEPETTDASATPWGKLIGIVLALSAVICLMLLAFLTPSYNSGAQDLPLAVAGPEAAVTQITGALEEKQPGAFDATTYASPEDARDAVLNRDEIGGIAVNDDNELTVYTAAGAGTSYKTLLTTIGSGLEDQGMTVSYDEVAPTTDDDPNATGLSVLALPLAFGGLISAALLSITMKKRYSLRVIGSLSFSVIAGFLVGAILQFGFGTFDASYWELSLILALGIAGTSMFVLGLESLIGYAGLGLGAVLTLFVSNPLSGIATGWQWLPSPWGMIGQYLPIGAAGNAARSVGFFDGAGATHSVVTLIVWVLIGLGFVGLATLKDRKAAS
jgi:hypothetical protein